MPKLSKCLAKTAIRNNKTDTRCGKITARWVLFIYANNIDKFIENIGSTIDGEEKREKFREVYIETFEREITKQKAKFILQGTLATDIIESGKVGESKMIKTHHNVGLNWKVEDLHPLKDLFKYLLRTIEKSNTLD